MKAGYVKNHIMAERNVLRLLTELLKTSLPIILRQGLT